MYLYYPYKTVSPQTKKQNMIQVMFPGNSDKQTFQASQIETSLYVVKDILVANHASV